MNSSFLTMTPVRPAGAPKYSPRPSVQVTRIGMGFRWRLMLSGGQLDSGKCRTHLEAMRRGRVARVQWLKGQP